MVEDLSIILGETSTGQEKFYTSLIIYKEWKYFEPQLITVDANEPKQSNLFTQLEFLITVINWLTVYILNKKHVPVKVECC